MSYSPSAVFTWCGRNQLQVGLPDAPLPVVRLDNITLAVARALELYGDDPPLAENQILSQGEQTVFRSALQTLRRAGYLTERQDQPPSVGLYALDAHPLTALVAKTLADDGRAVGVLADGSAVATKGEGEFLRQQIAARSQLPAPPSSWVAALTCVHVPDPARILPLMREDVPFVVATISPYAIEVSPLIIAGKTPCPMCVAHRLQKRDPTWQAVASQLRVRPVPEVSRAAIVLAGGEMITKIPAHLRPAKRCDALAGWRIDNATLQVTPTLWRYSPRCSCREIAPLAREAIVAT